MLAMNLRHASTALLAAALLGACGGGAPVPTPSPTDEQNAAVEVVAEEGAPIEVAVGDTFAIRVEANPSVGYEWEVAEAGDGQILEHDGFFYVDPGEGEQPAGGDVGVDYRFTAIAPGTTEILLERRYRGDVEDPPVERRHEVTVTE